MMVMTTNARMAPLNTTTLECLIAMMAAMKKVLSPNSETMMTESDATKPFVNPGSLAVAPVASVSLELVTLP